MRHGPWSWMSLRLAAYALVAASCLAGTTSVAREVPFLSAHVNDTAGIIPVEVKDRIEAKLKEFERAAGPQVAVLTIDGLDGESLEDYSLKVAQTWKLGHKGVDDGVLLLVAKNDRKMRIEVGYGLESKLTDAQSRRILDNILRPRFRSGDFGGGIEAGVDAITGTLQGKDVIPASAPSESQDLSKAPILVRLGAFAIFAIVVGVFSLIAVLSKGFGSWFLYLFLLPFYGVFPLALLGTGGLVLFLAWLVGFPIAKHWLRNTTGGKSFLKAHPGIAAFAASGGHSGSGGGWSSGGGGFSGGGGSFGGGGASSSW